MFYNTDSDLVRNNMILLWRLSGCWAVLEVGGGCSSYASLGSAGPQAAASSWGTQGLGPQQHSRQQHNSRATTPQHHHSTTALPSTRQPAPGGCYQGDSCGRQETGDKSVVVLWQRRL